MLFAFGSARHACVGKVMQAPLTWTLRNSDQFILIQNSYSTTASTVAAECQRGCWSDFFCSFTPLLLILLLLLLCWWYYCYCTAAADTNITIAFYAADSIAVDATDTILLFMLLTLLLLMLLLLLLLLLMLLLLYYCCSCYFAYVTPAAVLLHHYSYATDSTATAADATPADATPATKAQTLISKSLVNLCTNFEINHAILTYEGSYINQGEEVPEFYCSREEFLTIVMCKEQQFMYPHR